MKIAIVHDYLVHYGGAERVLEAILEIWDASVYTLVYYQKNLPEKFKQYKIYTSFIQRLPNSFHYEKYFPLCPLAIESFDFSQYDVVLSISSAWAKGIITTTETLHFCYLLNPMRFVWEELYSTLNRQKRIIRGIMNLIMNYLRIWDITSTYRVDYLITISQTIRKRALKYYNRDSIVIYPPVDTEFFTVNQNIKVQDYFLIVSRLKWHKRIDIAVKAFNKLGLPLLIIGDGEARSYLESIAAPNVQLLGSLSDEEIRRYYQGAQAVILPGIEDFGIVPLEAQSCATPVIAYRGGGATETIIENETGLFFYPMTDEALIKKVKEFDRGKFDSKVIRENALRFDKKIFQKKIKEFITEKYEEKIKCLA